MQSRRHEDFGIQSPAAKLSDRRIELGPDPYPIPRRDELDRSPPRSRRSLSPRKLEGRQRLLVGDRRSSSLERRDYGWDSSVVRSDQEWSRSPPFVQMHKRPHYDDGTSSRDLPPPELRRRYEFLEYMDANTDANTGLKHEYVHKHFGSRVIREKDFDGSRLADGGGHGMSGQKSMHLEEGAARRSFRLRADLGPTSRYFEGDGNFSLPSKNMNLDERVRYSNPLLLDKLSATESYGKGENPMFQSRDVSYPTVPASQSKDFKGTSQFKDFGSTSSGISRASFSGSHRDAMSLPTDEFPRSFIKFTDPLGFSGYGQRPILDSGRDHAAEHKDLTCYRRGTFSPTRGELRDYLYPRPGRRESDDHGNPSNDLCRTMALRERVDYDQRDFLKPSMMDPIAEHVDNIECSHRNLRESSLWDNSSLQKQTVPNYIGMSRSSTAPKQGGEYMNSGSSHVEFGRRVSREQEISHLGGSWDHEISHMKLDYGFGRDAGPVSHKQRMRNSPEFEYEGEVHRRYVRTEGMKEELGAYDPPDRLLKRKYSMDEEMSGHSSRRMMSNKWNNSSRIQDLDDRGEEWIDQDMSTSFSSRSLRYDHNLYRRVKKTYDGTDHSRGSASEDWLSSHDLEHVQEHSINEYRPNGRYIKGHSKPGSLGWHNSYRFNRRHVFPKPHNVWIRGRDDNQVDIHANEDDKSEEWVSSGKSELPEEDSEEFKQLVHNAFLVFTKKLNESPVVRKRYKEQGRAGSLFCIVCGRSLSKEFMDTQRLVTHAFMSHKVGLRAQHLGLHKAICVLLGWSSEASPDVITWVPEVISSAEALSQKEDLIIWPPVIVIHNSSISDNDPEGQKLITVEALGDFLRGKGFGGGKVKVGLGKPANHSILLVKFLGTFSGLQAAERLHNSFSENKHGRIDFERIACGKGKSSNSGEGGKQGTSMEELVLYGYMGIAEDLDRVDFDTKRKCTIKSKKEIQDLENAPVKPE